MANFQEEYSRYVVQLEELKEAMGKRDVNDETRRALSDSINRMQIYVDRAKEYVEKSERLASEAAKLKRTIDSRDRKIGELRELYRDLAIYMAQNANGIEERLDIEKQKAERLQRVSELLNSMSDGNTTTDYTKYESEQLAEEYKRVVSLNDSDKERLNEIYGEIDKNRIDILSDSERQVTDTSSAHKEENDVRTEGPSNIGESSHGTHEGETDAREEQGHMEEETPNLNSASTDIERDIEAIKKARFFKDTVYNRKERWDKITEIRNVRLQTGNYRADASQMKKAREIVKRQDDFIKSYINDFSKDYEFPAELTELIGIRDESRDKRDGNYKGTLIRPTVKQHLEPIEAIEKKLADNKMRNILVNRSEEDIKKLVNDNNQIPETIEMCKKALNMSDEEKKYYMNLKPLTADEIKKLHAEKEKRERRLGKKWLLKLKIDKLNAEIKSLEAELKTASPERQKEIRELLDTKREKLASLEKEYGDILAKIGELVSETVEKSILEKNGVKSFEELEQKAKQSKEASKTRVDENKQEIKSPTPNLNASALNYNGAGTSPAYGSGVQYPSYSSGAIPSVTGNNNSVATQGEKSTNPSNLPEKKKTLRERIAGIFHKKKDEKTENGKTEKAEDKRENAEVLYKEKLEYDFASQYAKFPIAKVEGKYFYHTVKKDDELLYVKEPVKNMECTERDLIAKVEELQKKFGGGYKKPNIFTRLYKGFQDITKDEYLREYEYEEEIKNPENYLKMSPKTIVKHQLGNSKGEERKMRIVKMMCGLESAYLRDEAFSAFSEGMSREQFNPSMGIEKDLIDIVDSCLVSPEFAKAIEVINARNKDLGYQILQGRDRFMNEFEADKENDFIVGEDLPSSTESKKDIKVGPLQVEAAIEQPTISGEPLNVNELDDDLSLDLPVDDTIYDWNLDDPELRENLVSTEDESKDAKKKIRVESKETLIPENTRGENTDARVPLEEGKRRPDLRVIEGRRNENTRFDTRGRRRVQNIPNVNRYDNPPKIPVFDRHAKKRKDKDDDEMSM